MEKDNEEKRGILEALRKKGVECGNKIADILEENENFDLVIPLYRCVMTVKTIDTSKEIGEVEHPGIEIRSFPDPHFWGNEINIDTIKEAETSKVFVRGTRTGLRFFKEKKPNKFKEMYTEGELKDLGVLED